MGFIQTGAPIVALVVLVEKSLQRSWQDAQDARRPGCEERRSVRAGRAGASEPRQGRTSFEGAGVWVCHSDSIAKEGLIPSVPYPIVPGHEIAGVVDAVGEGVIGWSVGTRVGVGWFGGHRGRCEPCRRGDLVDCRNLRIPGIKL
jgi:D-arabinose 1-dehydrogenase-like Zn-dependent alcohol dehydrogenase